MKNLCHCMCHSFFSWEMVVNQDAYGHCDNCKKTFMRKLLNKIKAWYGWLIGCQCECHRLGYHILDGRGCSQCDKKHLFPF